MVIVGGLLVLAGLVEAIAGPTVRAPPIAIAGDDTCPSPAQVARELAEIGDGAADAGAPGRFRARLRASVGAVPDSVHIDLIDQTGTRVAERDLPRKGSCDELARAAAAIIAAWIGAFEAEAPLQPPAPVERTPPRAEPVAAVSPPVAAAAWNARLTAGVLASRAGGDITAGAELALEVARASRHFGGHVALEVTNEHVTTVGSEGGQVRWRRFVSQVGPSVVARPGRWLLQAHGAVAAGMLQGQGTGFATNHSFLSEDFGVAAGIRAWRSSQAGAPWLGVEGLFWPAHHSLAIGPSNGVAEIPRFELQISFGFTLGSVL